MSQFVVLLTALSVSFTEPAPSTNACPAQAQVGQDCPAHCARCRGSQTAKVVESCPRSDCAQCNTKKVVQVATESSITSCGKACTAGKSCSESAVARLIAVADRELTNCAGKDCCETANAQTVTATTKSGECCEGKACCVDRECASEQQVAAGNCCKSREETKVAGIAVGGCVASPSPASAHAACPFHGFEVSGPEQIKHLLKAAKHLEAAGLGEMAAELRAKTEQYASRDQLERKMAQLAALNKEIAELKRRNGSKTQVAVKLRILEIDRKKCNDAEIQLPAPLDRDDGKFRIEQVEAAPCCFGSLIDSLVEDGIAKILSAPTMMTVSGRSVQVRIGEEFPVMKADNKGRVTIDFQHIGSSLDFLPTVIGKEMIRFETRIRHTSCESTPPTGVIGMVPKDLRVCEIDTGYETEAGKTIAAVLPWNKAVGEKVCCKEKCPTEASSTSLVFLITPEIVEPMEVAPSAGTRTAKRNVRTIVDKIERGQRQTPKAKAAPGPNVGVPIDVPRPRQIKRGS